MSLLGIKTLKSRLKRIEAKSKFKLYNAFYKSISRVQEHALLEALTRMILSDQGENVAIDYLMEELDIDQDTAIALWKAYRQAEDSRPVEYDEFDRMSDEELIEYIAKTREEIREMASHDVS